jgi:hypothetical protein
VEAVRQRLAHITDPSKIRKGGSGKWSLETQIPVPVPSDEPETVTALSLRTAAAAIPQSHFDYGFIAGLIAATYSVGAIAALAALEAGAAIPAGKGPDVEAQTTVSFMERSQELMRGLPTFRRFPPKDDLPINYEPEGPFWKVDWSAVEAEQHDAA